MAETKDLLVTLEDLKVVHDDHVSKFAGKVDKVDGKGLSSNDYDDAAKAKVDAIPDNPKYTDTIYNDSELQKSVNELRSDLQSTGISLGLTSATVGQTVRIKAVDTDGKPTAWEAAESGEKWEKIAEIIIPDDAEESNALTIDKDINGQPFSLLKARLCGKFPKYTGGSTIPNVMFAMLNGRANGNPSPAVYTSLWPKVETARLVGAVYEVDVSGVQVIESVLRSAGGGWGENMGMYGSSNSTYVKYFTDSLWAKPITSIGGTGMLIFPGCKFVLYGVRA